MSHTLVNKLITPDGTVLHSRHRHDYVEHIDKNGEWYMLDGGLDYIKTTNNIVSGTHLILTTDDAHDDIREHFDWGTRGKDGKGLLKFIPLCKITDDHLAAIVKTQTHLPAHLLKLFEDEINYRTTL